jgi:ribosomal protein L7Ae-like RNA K-turn-binding protein
LSVQSLIYICGAFCLVLLPKIDTVLAQVSTAMLVLLGVVHVIGHVITDRQFAKEEEAQQVRPRRRMYEAHEYVPPNREWSRRTKYRTYDGSAGPTKTCNPNLFHRGYVANDDSLMASKSCGSGAGTAVHKYQELLSAGAKPHLGAGTAVPKYQELLSAGAKPHLNVSQRKIHGEIIPEEDAKRLLERLHELEYRLDHRRMADGERKNSMPRRMAAGIRDAVRALQRGRAQAIVIASDAGSDSKVADLMAQASWKGVPVMVALPRAQLGKLIVRADITATVLVILHAEGCENLFEEVTGRKPHPPRSEAIPSNEPVGEESNAAGRDRTEPNVAKPNIYPWSSRTANATTRCVTPSYD